jgi:hypothetical protein
MRQVSVWILPVAIFTLPLLLSRPRPTPPPSRAALRFAPSAVPAPSGFGALSPSQAIEFALSLRVFRVTESPRPRLVASVAVLTRLRKDRGRNFGADARHAPRPAVLRPPPASCPATAPPGVPRRRPAAARLRAPASIFCFSSSPRRPRGHGGALPATACSTAQVVFYSEFYLDR